MNYPFPGNNNLKKFKRKKISLFFLPDYPTGNTILCYFLFRIISNILMIFQLKNLKIPNSALFPGRKRKEINIFFIPGVPRIED